MGPLTFGAALPLLVVVQSAASDPVVQWHVEIAEASARFGIPEAWIERVMRAESGGRTTLGGRYIRSPKGAIGLMQLMPATWDDMRARLGLGADPDDPRHNILAGTFYLRLMYERFGYPGLFGAYNGGPARYAAWLAGRARLPGETVAYLAKVGAPEGVVAGANGAASADRAASAPPKPPLFVIRAREEAGNSNRPDAAQPALFAIRKDGR